MNKHKVKHHRNFETKTANRDRNYDTKTANRDRNFDTKTANRDHIRTTALERLVMNNWGGGGLN